MGEAREYEQPPLDESDLEWFHAWWGYQVSVGSAVAFGPAGGRPAGYRESQPGRWSREGVERSIDLAAAQQVLFVRDFLRERGWAYFEPAWAAGRPFLRAWREEALRDPDIIGPDGAVPDTWTASDLALATEPALGAWRYLVGGDPPEGAEAARGAGLRLDDAADFDPLRTAYGLDPPRRVAADPFAAHTQRVVRERDARGRFTGRREVRAVPILVLPHTSELGAAVRIIDADRGGRPPRGALARIRTTPTPEPGAPRPRRVRWAFVVPVSAGGSFAGSRREDPKHRERRRVANAESVQLYDHRTGAPREVEILVGPRSRNHDLALRFAAAVNDARRQGETKR